MIQNHATSEENFVRFVKRAKENKLIWCLVSPSGNPAFCPSNEYEGSDVVVFWSDRAYAERHAVKEWKKYKARSIAFEDFVGSYLKDLQERKFLVGPNWDAHLFGKEMEAIELAKNLTSEEK